MMKKYKKIAYAVAYHLKDTGNIVQYFIDNTEDFYLYLYPSSYKNAPSIMAYYSNGKLTYQEKKFYYRGNKKLLILLFYYTNYIYFILKFRITKTYLIVNNPQLCVGSSIIKLLTKNETVFWIWDYFPKKKGLLKVYHSIVNYYNERLHYVLYLSPKLNELYKSSQSKYTRRTIVFGIQNLRIKRNVKKNLIGYIGNIRKGQGIEHIFEALLVNRKLKLEIIGDGESKKDLVKFIKQYNLEKRVSFLGFIDNNSLSRIVSKWEVGIAVYDPSPLYVTMYTDPSKVKLYLQYELPVIMTKITYLYSELDKAKAGVGIDFSSLALVNAIAKIQKSYRRYQSGAIELKQKYEYDKWYAAKFTFFEKDTNINDKAE